MNKVRAIIIDDEPAAVGLIRELILELTKDIVIVTEATNGVEAVHAIIEYKPELIFLDINMPLVNGIQVLEKMPQIDFAVIFTTGSPNYALKAIKFEAVDYLVKPIDPSDFILAVSKARRRIQQGKWNKPEKNEAKIPLHSSNDISYIKEEDILYVAGMGSYSQVVTIQGEKITVSKSIGQMEERLSAGLFYRCHASYLVNLSQVSKFTTRDGPQLIMNDGSKVEVSRRNKDGLLKRLNEQ